MDTASSVREQLLEQAIRLMMQRGYNGFSYRDLSNLVGVKTSSIHYYFPSKEDLALEAVMEYSDRVLASLQDVEPDLPADVKLAKYAKLFSKVLGDGDQICLCGMLAADISSLPDNVRKAVQAFFKANEAWLAKTVEQGRSEGTLRVKGKPEHVARSLFAAFQGSVLASRLFGTKSRIEDAVAALT